MNKTTYSLHENIKGYPTAHIETDESYDYFIDGYKHSIEALFISIEKNKSSKFYLDSVIYPLMMQVHYWLEVSFKSLYWECQKTLYENGLISDIPTNTNSSGKTSYDIHQYGHELPKLLGSLTEKLQEIDENWYKQLNFSQLTLFTNELHKITKDGSAWRYLHPSVKKGVFTEAEFSFDYFSYGVIERIWENIQEEVKDMKLLATNRPMNINPTNRTKDFYERKNNRLEKHRLKLK